MPLVYYCWYFHLEITGSGLAMTMPRPSTDERVVEFVFAVTKADLDAGLHTASVRPVNQSTVRTK